MYLAMKNIKFRSNREQVNYEVGDKILPKHEHIVKTYFSGLILEERVPWIRPQVPVARTVNRRNHLDGMMEIVEETRNSVDELKRMTRKLSEIRGQEDIEHIPMIVEEVFVPSEQETEVEGNVIENKTEGPKISNKIKKLRKLKDEKND